MCLDNIDPEVKVTEGVGYKTTFKVRGRYVSPIMKIKTPLNRWLHDDKPGEILINLGNRYPMGYHVFLSHEAAVQFGSSPKNVMLCKFKDVVATGKENISGVSYDVVIARSIKLNLIPAE